MARLKADTVMTSFLTSYHHLWVQGFYPSPQCLSPPIPLCSIFSLCFSPAGSSQGTGSSPSLPLPNGLTVALSTGSSSLLWVIPISCAVPSSSHLPSLLPRPNG